MKLEEAKQNLEKMIRTFDIQAPNVSVRNAAILKKQTIETVLQALDNSVSKDEIRKEIEKWEEIDTSVSLAFSHLLGD